MQGRCLALDVAVAQHIETRAVTMANTHMAVIKSLDNRLTLIGAGDEGQVREYLAQWLRTHAGALYDTPMILQVIDSNPEG